MAGDRVSLADLGLDTAEPSDDPGTHWHPRPDKTEARDSDGNLRDLDDDEVTEHGEKDEADDQYDGVRRRRREDRAPGAAEDSDHSGAGEV